MDDNERPAEVERETTVINTGGGSGGGGGVIVAILVLAVIAIAGFLYFNGTLQRVADKTDINVNVDAPKVELPDVTVQTQPPAQAPAPAEPPAANQAGK